MPGREATQGRAASAALLLAIVVHLVVGALALADAPQPQSDFDRYFEIATGAGRPYVDYQVEHPVGTLTVFKLLAAIPGGRASFGRGVVVVNALADAALIGALAGVWGIPAAAYYAVVTVPIANLLFHRIDLWSMAAATLAVTAWRCGKPSLAALLLAVGASFKLWPLVLFFMLWNSTSRTRALVVFTLSAGAIASAAIAIGGPRAILEVLTFRGATGWQIESLVGSVIHLFTGEPARMQSGAWRIGTVGRLASIALFLAAAPLCIWASWRGFRVNRPGIAWLAAVATLLSLSALFSAQYVGWLVPAGALAWAGDQTWTGDQKRSALLTAAVVALTQLFMRGYDDVIAGVPLMVALVVLRNAVVIVLTVVTLAALARPLPAEPHLQS
jgi:hypothetical protein